MAHGRLGSGVVVLVILVIAGAVGLVRAQTGCATESVSDDVFSYCEGYLGDLLTTPDPTCCTELRTVQYVWGSDCYCDLLQYWQDTDFPVDMTLAYTLPQACNVSVNCKAAPPRSSTVSAPSTSTSSPPPPAALLPPPVDLLPPAAALLPPPAGLTPTPPGFTPPTIPDFVLPSPPSKGKSSLAVPIGATAGGLTVGAVIIWVVYLIMSKCDISLKLDLNQPCCCCYRKPKAHLEKPDNNMHNVPPRPYFYGV